MKRYLILVLILAMSLGVIYWLLDPDSITPRRDALVYDAIGWNLVQGQGFSVQEGAPTALRGPVYPYFLALVYMFAGHYYQTVRGVQILIHGLNALLVYALGAKIFERKTGLSAALAYVVYPAFVFYTGLLLTETLFTGLLLAAMCCLLHAMERESRLWAAVSGALLGLATLCKPTTLLFPIILGMILSVREETRRLVKLAVTLAFTMALVVTPWMARNYNLFERFVPVSVFTGYNLLLGSLPPESDFDLAAFKAEYFSDPVQEDREAFAQGITNVLSNPLGYILGRPEKLVRFLLPEGMAVIGSSKTPQGVALILTQVAILALALRGWLIKPLSPSHLALASLCAYFALAHVALISTPRFNLPVMPYALIFCAAGMREILK